MSNFIGKNKHKKIEKKLDMFIMLFLRYTREARDCVEYSGERRNYVMIYESETRGERVVVVETAEEEWA